MNVLGLVLLYSVAFAQMTWELEEVVVEGEKPAESYEDQKVGDYLQPRWTARHRGFVRAYVRPKGMVEFLTYFDVKNYADGNSKIRTTYEIETGLGRRFQLDLYFSTEHTTVDDKTVIRGLSVELRYALADWGKIFANPTLYLEYWYVKKGGPCGEIKALFSGNLAPGLWGSLNLVYEKYFKKDKIEYKALFAIDKLIKEKALSLGIGGLYEFEIENKAEEANLFIGPRLTIKPHKRVDIDITPTFGVNAGAPPTRIFAFLGFEL